MQSQINYSGIPSTEIKQVKHLNLHLNLGVGGLNVMYIDPSLEYAFAVPVMVPPNPKDYYGASNIEGVDPALMYERDMRKYNEASAAFGNRYIRDFGISGGMCVVLLMPEGWEPIQEPCSDCPNECASEE